MLRDVVGVLLVVKSLERRLVIGSRTLIVESGGTISLEVGGLSERSVDGELSVVDTKAVSVSVGVGEETRLENGIGTGLDSRDEVGRREGDLLDLGEVILNVLVEGKLSNRSKRELLLRPGLGQVENVVSELLSLFRSHDLNVESPRREFLTFNRFEQVSSGVIGSSSSGLSSLLISESLDTLIRLVVELNVNERSILLDHLVSVSRVSMHESVSVRSSSSVREENGELMERFRVERGVVPEVVGILQVSLRVSLLSVNEVRELHRVSEEEDGSVVVNVIPVSFLRSQLDRETTRVTSGIGRSTLPSDSRETSGGADLGSDLREEFGASQVGDVVGNFESSMSSCSLGVNDTLGDTLSVEVSEGIDQVEVLKEERSLSSSTLSGVWLLKRVTLRVGECGAIRLLHNFFGRHIDIKFGVSV